MKKNKLRLLSGLLALTMLSGCGAQQIQPETTSVNQAMLIELSSQGQESYTFPERFTGSWSGQDGKVSIDADAEVVAKQGVVLPTATVTPRTFTQADVDNLLKIFLKGAPLYDCVGTKENYRKQLEYIKSPEWLSNPDGPAQTPEQLNARREKLIAHYTEQLEKAPEERPVIHGFSDSHDPSSVTGTATVDGINMAVNINAKEEFGWAVIYREGYGPSNFGDEYHATNVGEPPSQEEAIAQADALMQELGMSNMVCDDVQSQGNGTLMLYYVPSVNGIRLPSIREDHLMANGTRSHYQYWYYGSAEEKNPDKVSWEMERVKIDVSKDGICCFQWYSPSGETLVKETQTALLPFEEIASVASTMLPIVIQGPEETSLIDVDRINGHETHMDVKITEVSLSLMRIRDKGSLQGTVVPVWDFWGTWDWYNVDGQNSGKHVDTVQPMLTLNAIDGSVVSRAFGY